MYNHAPKNYKCPLCLTVNGIESQDTMMKQADIFYRDNLVMAAVNSKFIGNNPGHIIIFPVGHFENLYDLPDQVGHQVITIARKIAMALKKIRNCEGVMLLQNNEPASGQHAFHFHLHIFPRFVNDNLHQNMSDVRVSLPSERQNYSQPLKIFFAQNQK